MSWGELWLLQFKGQYCAHGKTSAKLAGQASFSWILAGKKGKWITFTGNGRRINDLWLTTVCLMWGQLWQRQMFRDTSLPATKASMLATPLGRVLRVEKVPKSFQASFKTVSIVIRKKKTILDGEAVKEATMIIANTKQKWNWSDLDSVQHPADGCQSAAPGLGGGG